MASYAKPPVSNLSNFYLDDIANVSAHASKPLSLQKRLFRRVTTSAGRRLEPVEGPVRVGDELAPERDRSGASNSLTLDRPLSVRTAASGFQFVNGTPTDCVHLAVTGLLPVLPHMVVSGINHGSNMGDDTIYSGTVAAAMEGYLFGVPAIAFSQAEKGWTHLDAAARTARRVVESVLPLLARGGEVRPWLLNVNIPNRPDADQLPWSTTRLGRRHASSPVIAQTNPRGEPIYWIGPAGDAREAGEGTDFHAVAQGRVSITPLQVDLTEHATLGSWKQRLGL